MWSKVLRQENDSLGVLDLGKMPFRTACLFVPEDGVSL